MERISANAGKPTRRTHKGRAWLVTPATLIVPGVLAGSQGALYYPPEEVSRDPQRWNGVPITVGHPVKNGQHVSGRDPDVLEEFGIGHVYRATANGKLTAEAWIDVEATRNYDRRNGTGILRRLEAGEKVELSTGLFTDNHPSPGTYNGRAYTHVARNYRPDHLALLHDQRGACNTGDGCGFNANADPESMNRLAQTIDAMNGTYYTRTLKFEKATEGQPADLDIWNWADTSPAFQEEWANVTANLRADSLLAELDGLIGVNVAGQVKSKVTGWFKRLGAGTGKGPVHEAAQDGAMTLDDDDKRLGADAAAQFASAGHNPASWVADEAIWERAKTAAAKYAEDAPESYYAVVTHIYKRMGGAVQEATENTTTNPSGDPDMAFDKKATVAYLTANCDCYKGQDATLNGMSDDALALLQKRLQKEIADRQKSAAVLNQFTQGIQLGAATLTVNSDGKPVLRNADGEECAPDDKECLAMMEGKKKPAPVPPAANAALDPKAIEAIVAKSLGFATLDEAKATLNTAKEIETAERRKLVAELVGNIADDGARQAKAQRLLKLPTADLRERLEDVRAAIAANRAETLPAANQADWVPEYRPTLYAPGGPPSGYGGGEPEVLDLPVMNWDTTK